MTPTVILLSCLAFWSLAVAAGIALLAGLVWLALRADLESAFWVGAIALCLLAVLVDWLGSLGGEVE